jgi:plasmid stabilization system protein ParE
MRYRIVFSPRSRRDLDRILEWITSESKESSVAGRFIRELLLACKLLETLPERFPPYPHALNWRMKPHRNYLVFFQIHGAEVRIGHIRHGARRPFKGP